MAVVRSGVDIGGCRDKYLSTGFDGRPPRPRTSIFAARNVRANKVSRLKPKVLLLPREIPNREAIAVGPATLAISAPFGRPDLHIGGQGRKWAIRRTFSDAQCVVVVLFGQRALHALHFGPAAGAAFYGES